MKTKTRSYKVNPNSVYVWRGFKATTMTYDKFTEFLGSVFVPACGLLQPRVGLRAYLPSMVPQESKPISVPDQTALMFWANPESHDLAARVIAVRIYQNLHGDVYDMTRSKLPEVPILISTVTGILQAEQPYYLLDKPADWMLGIVNHLVGARRTDLKPTDFFTAVYKWAIAFRNNTPNGIDGALVCCGNDYVVAWVHGTGQEQNVATALDGLANLTIPILHQNANPLQLAAGLWDDWPGLDLKKDTCINIQFQRPTTSKAVPGNPVEK